MRSFCTRFLIVLLAAALAAGGGPALAEPLGSGIVDPIRHEVTGVGSGSLEALLKKHKVPPEIRDAVLRSFELDRTSRAGCRSNPSSGWSMRSFPPPWRKGTRGSSCARSGFGPMASCSISTAMAGAASLPST